MMTEAELVEFIPLYIGVAQGSLNTTFALIFGYLIAAYTAGADLTRAQVTVGTLLYIIAVTWTSIGGTSAVLRAAHFGNQLKAMKPDETIAIVQINPLFGYSGVLLLLLGSIWFMWSIRHPKTE